MLHYSDRNQFSLVCCSFATVTGSVNIYHREERIRGVDDQDHWNTGAFTAFVHTCRGNRGQPTSLWKRSGNTRRDEATPAMANMRVIPNFTISAQSTTSSDTFSAWSRLIEEILVRIFDPINSFLLPAKASSLKLSIEKGSELFWRFAFLVESELPCASVYHG